MSLTSSEVKLIFLTLTLPQSKNMHINTNWRLLLAPIGELEWWLCSGVKLQQIIFVDY